MTALEEECPEWVGAGWSSPPQRSPLRNDAQRSVIAVLAALHGRPGAEAAPLLATMSEDPVLAHVLGANGAALLNLLDVLRTDIAYRDDSAAVDMFDLEPWLANHGSKVADALRQVQQGVPDAERLDPQRELAALCERILAQRSAAAATEFAAAVRADAPRRELLELHRKIAAPVRAAAGETELALHNQGSARDWSQRICDQSNSWNRMRFSSGMPTLDGAVSAPGVVRGFIAPGEIVLVPAGTGHGKSAFARQLALAMTLDMVHGWGCTENQVMFAFTEESAEIVMAAARVADGMAFEDLQDNLYLIDANDSGPALVLGFYALIRRAAAKARDTGRHIRNFVPLIYLFDYLQGARWADVRSDPEQAVRTADVFMRGIAKCDPETLARLSGMSYQEATGEPWPTGLEGHRVAVVLTAQLTKMPTKVEYTPGAELAEFVSFWDDKPLWDVRPGDFFIPSTSYVAGGAGVLNHATITMYLHRSKPRQSSNPVIPGYGPKDKRARFIIEKGRNGASVPVIPARFDSATHTEDGRQRGQFFDDCAWQHLVADRPADKSPGFDTRFAVNPGDPMIPVRATGEDNDVVWY